jgi:hypothetical protein
MTRDDDEDERPAPFVASSRRKPPLHSQIERHVAAECDEEVRDLNPSLTTISSLNAEAHHWSEGGREDDAIFAGVFSWRRERDSNPR